MPHRTLVKIAGYILGEFGHTIAETAGSTAEDQLRALHEHFLQVRRHCRRGQGGGLHGKLTFSVAGALS